MAQDELTKRLRIVWDNNPPHRYVPQAIVGRMPGSYGWTVFDRKESKELENAEILALPVEAMNEIMAN